MTSHPMTLHRVGASGSKRRSKASARKLARTVTPTGVERFFEEGEIIVSKTDPTGRITYANDVFLRVAGYDEDEVLGAPHSVVRHPAMPRAVFKLLWDTIQAKQEIFAYVVNLAKNGDHYWVLAHVTPTIDAAGNITGYHSNRRVPDRDAIAKVEPLYKQLCEIEARHTDRKAGLEASFQAVLDLLQEKGCSYDEFVLAL